MTTLQAPVDLSAPVKAGPRIYRKQVLAKRRIGYPMPDGTRREVVFDDEYLRDLADAYVGGAYDLVPFQLADPANRHNEDPRQYGGRVIGAEVTDDGLDLILELADDTAELVERTGRRLGVSARIKEQLEHVDGRKFKRAIRHVLGTLDPRMTGMRPWEPIDLSSDTDPDHIDLSGYTYQEADMPRPTHIDLSTLSPDDADELLALAAANGIDLSDALEDDEPGGDEPGGDEPDEDEPDEDEPDEDEPEGITDDELEALLDAELADVQLSEDRDADALDLAGEHAVEGEEQQVDLADGPAPERDEAAALRFQLAARDYARKGVPPHLIDLAEPLLSLSDDDADALDLSTPTGESVDVRGIVRDMLDAVAGAIDLSSEQGFGHETEPDEQVSDLAAAWTDFLSNNGN